MYTGTPDAILEKWKPVLDVDGVAPIRSKDRALIAQILECQHTGSKTANMQLLSEAPNAVGNAQVSNWDPIMISMLRRSLPNLMAMDTAGVIPMTGPTSKIFAQKAHYTDKNGAEALFNEADTDFSGTGIHGGDPSSLPDGVNSTDVGSAASSLIGAGTGDTVADDFGFGSAYTTAQGETLGAQGGETWGEMAVSIGDVTVTAGTRGLRTKYTVEFAQDLMAIHGENAQDLLANMLQNEILAEINREFVRSLTSRAVRGATNATAAGTFDLSTDADGRWSDEKVKGLLRQINIEANAIAKATRFGKGNFIITSSDVADALASAGVMTYTPELKNNLEVDDTGNTYAGNLGSGMKVYIDPYAVIDYVLVGWKGTQAHEAGMFYCPYVPLQFQQALDPESLQPVIAFKTRYALQSNPYAEATYQDGIGTLRGNTFYRVFLIKNIL